MTFILATTENGTQTTSDEQSVICSPPGDTAPPPETQEEHTKVGYSIDATVKQSLVEQLYFTKIDERLTGLTGAQGTTCRWFLAKPEYAAWQDVAQQSEHGGFLWIKGNPGTGKSTLMKFLFEEANHNRKSDPSRITLSFFFLARGTIEEKSTTGLYRSLLHQLFQKAVDLKDCLEWMTADGARGVEQNGWHEAALKQTLMHALPKLGSRSLTIFVDALDECDQSQAASMVNFFEELCDRATEAQVNLQICFSSRHYPTIIIQKGIEVTLEDEDGHIQDIQQYIKSNLRLGKSKQAEPLRSEILEKSSGIFLWVVLVLDILNAEYPNSLVSTKAIRNRLKEIPPGLHDLFEMILARDGDNLERLQMCLKWILFAARTLKPQELYFAIQLGLDKESSTCWDQEDVELDGLKTFVRSSSKGLAEVTRNKASEVQFIHQSVRDFLLGRYGAQWSGVGSFEGNCHNMLRDCCLAQLNASISQEVEIPDTPLEQPRAAKELRRRVKLKFPLLEYSVLNVLHHANYAQQHGVEQKGFLASFPLPRWVLLNNTLEMYLIRRHTKTVSLLYILAERNLADLIRIHPQAMSCFDVGDERYGLPIFAALATDSYEAIESFLDVQPVIQTQGPLHDLCKRFCRDRGRRHLFNRSFTFPRERRLLSYIIEHDDERVLALFINAGLPNVEDLARHGVLSYAAQRGYRVVVAMLLTINGIDIELKDGTGRTPLCWAAHNGHDTILLLEKGADIESKDDDGRTPLLLATDTGNDTIVRLLLEKGADIESKDNSGRTPLLLAIQERHDTTIRLLLEKGADIESRDRDA
ncbi:ankyrin [Coniochaeta ligniaria NRRL 30616]|uniref:Ankyrin n=1 Tax=Coniochaeta ligniaria NRRL 30616 TaxID=1408157 RepID=A0A1J7JK06_9PEZI|nr:ankyrin [Coniochaeta ligniaria NRRL 30616]